MEILAINSGLVNSESEKYKVIFEVLKCAIYSYLAKIEFNTKRYSFLNEVVDRWIDHLVLLSLGTQLVLSEKMA